MTRYRTVYPSMVAEGAVQFMGIKKLVEVNLVIYKRRVGKCKIHPTWKIRNFEDSTGKVCSTELPHLLCWCDLKGCDLLEAGCNRRPEWLLQYLGTNWSIIHIGPLGSKLFHLCPLGSKLFHMIWFRSTWVHMGQLDSTWVHLNPPWSTGVYLGVLVYLCT